MELFSDEWKKKVLQECSKETIAGMLQELGKKYTELKYGKFDTTTKKHHCKMGNSN